MQDNRYVLWHKDEKGSVAVIGAMLIFILTTLLVMAAYIGIFFLYKKKLQNVAEAAVQAAADTATDIMREYAAINKGSAISEREDITIYLTATNINDLLTNDKGKIIDAAKEIIRANGIITEPVITYPTYPFGNLYPNCPEGSPPLIGVSVKVSETIPGALQFIPDLDTGKKEITGSATIAIKVCK